MGYVAGDGKLFWLTPRVRSLGQSYLESARLPRIVQPFLQRVAAGTHEIAYLSVMDGDEVVYIARNGPNRSMRTWLRARRPGAGAGHGVGMLMLAMRSDEERCLWLTTHELTVFTSHTIASKERMKLELARIRAQGWSALGAAAGPHRAASRQPLRHRHGELVGALNITMPMAMKAARTPGARVLLVRVKRRRRCAI